AATRRTRVDSRTTIGPAPRAKRLPETELGATQLYPRRIGQVAALVEGAAVLGEMFRGSSRVKRRTLRLRTPCGEPVKPEASAPRYAYSQLACRKKIRDFANEDYASFHSDLSDWKVQSECEYALQIRNRSHAKAQRR